jgi:PAS domain-containing protein
MAKEEARRLLLITGDRGDVRSVDRALSGSPWEVDVVRDGESAVRALAQRSFDAGLLGLPLEPQGLALLRTLRPQMDGIPILLLTDTEDPGLADCVSLETWPETIPRSLLRTDLLARTLSHVVLRREIAKKLSQQEDLLRVSERIARMGGWEYDVATGANSWTSGLYELYGVARDYPISDVSAITRNFVDGGQERAVAAFRRALSMGKGFDFEEPFVEARGKQLWVRLTAEPVLEAGRVVKLRGNMIDVTGARTAESPRAARSDPSLRLAPYLRWLGSVRQPEVLRVVW